MARIIPLTLQWPNGQSVHVRVDIMLTPMSILALSQRSASNDAMIFHNGRILEPYLSIAHHQVHAGDTLVIYERSPVKQPSTRITKLEAKTESLFREVLRVNDLHFTAFDSENRSGNAYPNLTDLTDDDPSEEFRIPQDETVIGQPNLATNPLPLLFDEDESEDEDWLKDPKFPDFETIEEAAKFFRKHPGPRWCW
jgi:hypothetical protein